MRYFQILFQSLLFIALMSVLNACSKNSPSSNLHEQTTRIINPDFNGGTYSTLYKRYYLWGSDATIRWSADGTTWHQTNVPTTEAIVDLAIGENDQAKNTKDSVIIAVDAGGLILRSNDAGNNWSKVTYPPTTTTTTTTTTTNFKHVIYIAKFNVWFVLGDKGRFLSSSDQGLTWQSINLGPAMAKLAVESISLSAKTSRLLIGGDEGLIGHSDDGGKSWQIKQLELETSITQFFYASDRLVAGSTKGKFLTSDDDGTTWEAFETDGQARFTGGIYDAASRTLLMISHNGKLLRGTDDAHTWELTNLPYGGSLNYLSNIIVDTKHHAIRVFGFSGTHLLTRDGGAHWESQPADAQNNFENIVLQPDTQTMISYGRGGLAARSENSGQTWHSIFPKTDVYLRNARVTPKGTWITSGELGVILRSTDKGKSWQQSAITYTDPFTPPTYRALLIEPDANAIIAAGPTGSILRSENDGQDWQTVYYSTFDKGEAFTDVIIDKTHNAIIAVEAWGRHQRSTDGGRTWQSTATSGEREFWQAAVISKENESVVLLAGQQGLASRSLDGGKSWEALEPADKVDWFGCFGDSTTQSLFLLGAQGKINRSLDGGKTWQSQTTNVTGDLRRILREPKSGVLVAYGGQGIILRSADKGNSWSKMESGINEELRDGVVDSNGKIYLTGQAGRILSSADQGLTWVVHNTHTKAHFRSLIEDGDHLLAVGQRVLMTTK